MTHTYAVHTGRATNTVSLWAFASLPTSSGTVENVLEQGSQTLFGAGKCLHQPSFYSRTFANSVRKQCSAGVNAPIKESIWTTFLVSILNWRCLLAITVRANKAIDIGLSLRTSCTDDLFRGHALDDSTQVVTRNGKIFKAEIRLESAWISFIR